MSCQRTWRQHMGLRCAPSNDRATWAKLPSSPSFEMGASVRWVRAYDTQNVGTTHPTTTELRGLVTTGTGDCLFVGCVVLSATVICNSVVVGCIVPTFCSRAPTTSRPRGPLVSQNRCSRHRALRHARIRGGNISRLGAPPRMMEQLGRNCRLYRRLKRAHRSGRLGSTTIKTWARHIPRLQNYEALLRPGQAVVYAGDASC